MFDIELYPGASGRVKMEYTEGKKAAYMYASATQAELNAYMAALEECGFTGGSFNTPEFGYYSNGTSGDNDYREVLVVATT